MQRIEPHSQHESVPHLAIPPSQWRNDSFIRQLAQAALGQFDLAQRVSPEEFIEVTSGLVIAQGDDELQEDILQNFVTNHAEIFKSNFLQGQFERALEWFERASRIDPSVGRAGADGEDLFSCVGTSETGSHVDYRNPVKERWRECWAGWLESLTHVEDRADMKILCMPSPQVWPEIRHYLERGFKASNIFGVEGGDSEARRVFAANCQRYGINPVLGRLENVVPKLDHTFSIVLLDLLGPISFKVESILRAVRLADRAFIGLNTMAARESRATQEGLRWLSGPGSSPLQAVKSFMDSVPAVTPALAAIRHETARKTDIMASDPHLSNTREIMGPFIVAGADARNPLSDPVLPSINRVATLLGIVPTEAQVSRIRDEAPQMVMELALEAFDGLPEAFGSTSLLIKSMLGGHILGFLGFQRRPLMIQTLGYYSQVSDKRIPYHSSFVMSERSADIQCAEGSIPRQILDFILDRVVDAFLTERDAVRFSTGVRAGAKPSLVMHSEHGASVTIELDRMQAEIQAYLASAKERFGILQDCPELVLAQERTWLNSRNDAD